jgi:hypothetical protein
MTYIDWSQIVSLHSVDSETAVPVTTRGAWVGPIGNYSLYQAVNIVIGRWEEGSLRRKYARIVLENNEEYDLQKIEALARRDDFLRDENPIGDFSRFSVERIEDRQIWVKDPAGNEHGFYYSSILEDAPTGYVRYSDEAPPGKHQANALLFARMEAKRRGLI